MNQILVTKKIYVTPDMKRKKKIYKFDFFISVFLVCVLFSYYIYAEYDRNKNEKVSQDILSTIDMEYIANEYDDKTVRMEDNVLVVALGSESDNSNVQVAQTTQPEEVSLSELSKEKFIQTTQNGQEYYTAAVLNIPKLGINYPVLSDTSVELLKISLNKYWGPEANEVGNYCIVGHNYKNTRFFSKLNELVNGDVVELTDLTGRTLQYRIYDSYIVEPTDVACTSQLTRGRKELTLITCANNGKQRLVVKATEIKQN